MKPRILASFWDVSGRDQETLFGTLYFTGVDTGVVAWLLSLRVSSHCDPQMRCLRPGVGRRGGEAFQLPGK